MRIEAAFKMGVFLIIAAAMSIGLWRFMQDPQRQKAGYELKVVVKNAQGLSPGTDVRMRGIPVGFVDKTELDSRNRAVFVLKINENTKVFHGSTFRVALDNFLGQKVVEIEPPEHPRPGKVYRPGQVVVVREQDPAINDIMLQSNAALSNVNLLLQDLRGLVSDMTMEGSVPRLLEEFTELGQELQATAAAARVILESGQGNIRASLQNVEQVTVKADLMADQISDILRDVKGTTGKANKLITDPAVEDNLKGIMTDLRATAATLRESMDALGSLVKDDEVQEDIRGAIKDARHTLATANTTMGDAQKAIGSFTGLIEGLNSLEVKPSLELRYEATVDKFQSDMNMRLYPKDEKLFYYIGFDDVGESQSTNLMLGVQANENIWFRGGLKSGKLSLGFDMEQTDDTLYTLDLIDPNDMTLNFRGARRIGDELFVQLGMEDIADDDHFSVGLMQRY